MPRKRKKRKTQHTKPRNGSIGRTNWDGLSRDLMLKILATLNPVDLIFGASLVCHSWRSLCWEVLFVKENNTFDFTALKFLSRFGKGATGSDLMAWLRIFENVMESYHDVDDDGVCSVTSIIFPYGLHLFDNHLVYLAQRSSKLKTLYLPCSTKITGKGFSRAIRNWKKLEEILIGPIEISYIDHIFQEMGINCKRLEILCLSQTRLDEYTAVVIAKNLRELKEVRLHCVSLSKLGIQVLLSKCTKLLKVNFKCCQYFVRVGELKKVIKGSDAMWSMDTRAELYCLKDIMTIIWK